MNNLKDDIQIFNIIYPFTQANEYQPMHFDHSDNFNREDTFIQNVFDKYWLWGISDFWAWSNSNQAKEEKKKLVRRVPKFKSIDFQDHFERIIAYLDSINDFSTIIYTKRVKKTFRLNASIKRSSYFGVNKNGPNWQTLVTIWGRKTYVGTFMTEETAARAFDFFSMLLQIDHAKTNFNYNKIQALSLVTEFSYLISQ